MFGVLSARGRCQYVSYGCRFATPTGQRCHSLRFTSRPPFATRSFHFVSPVFACSSPPFAMRLWPVLVQRGHVPDDRSRTDLGADAGLLSAGLTPAILHCLLSLLVHTYWCLERLQVEINASVQHTKANLQRACDNDDCKQTHFA